MIVESDIMCYKYMSNILDTHLLIHVSEYINFNIILFILSVGNSTTSITIAQRSICF